MLKPIITHIIFGIFVICWWYWLGGVWVFVIALHIYLAVLFYGSAFIASGFYVKAFCVAPTTEKVVVLTFDDGVHPEYTPQVLDILQRYRAPAAFFCIGKHLESAESGDILRRMTAEGHLIGNHSYSHAPFFDFYRRNTVKMELERTAALIKNATGSAPKWFRPPYGVTNPPIGRAVRDLGLQVAGWSLRSLDTVITNEEQLLARIAKQLHPGAIILLHDHHPRMVSFLPKLLDYLISQHYTIITLDALHHKTLDHA